MPEQRVTAAIALGSNLPSRFGDSHRNVLEAASRLTDLGTVLRLSSLYETDPVGSLDQPRFVNAAALLETTLTPLELLHAMLAIEHAMGRDRAGAPPKGPRIIDLDLLLFSDVVYRDSYLTLPHPAMHKRRFVLQPLAEVAPEMLHPLRGKTVQQMLAELPFKI